ncbi:MAG: efflux RND transporter periplasmic adaptor subunit [Proteobacteria bacterium]|nr:efflux RND transporter periplasmic adaptor subunit [Pseudomonadota bacterium]
MSAQRASQREGEPRRARGAAARAAAASLLLALGASLGAVTVWLAMRERPSARPAAVAAKKNPLFQCPMHPAITADHPSDCPICGMKLVEVKPAVSSGRATAPPAERKIRFYRSPMDPRQTSPTPRKDAMGMDYLPVYSEEAPGAGVAPVAGLAGVTIDAARQQLIGLRTAPVTRGAVAASWRTVGRIERDPTRVRMTNIKVEGYIERLYVDFVGRPVRKHEPLFSLYSPSLLAAEHEYLLALQAKEALSADVALRRDGDTLVASARRKLELWDVPRSELARLERTREPSQTLVFLSPIAGVVTAKNVVEGARVNPGDTPYEITDLSVVWVMADAYELDLPRVKVGMPASLTLQAYPEQRFKGRVAFVDPLLDPQTRTAKVHLHFPTPQRRLRPGGFGEVVLEGSAREGLRIALDSVLRSGTRDVVFVALGDGRFAPREVQLGATSGAQVEVVAGLVEGQQVVTRANFLVDSESQLRSALAALGGAGP